jgi:putative ABC transport system permease protein
MLKSRTLIIRSLCYYWRTHLGVLLGVIVAAAVLVGAMVVGDSVRLSLRAMALDRLGDTRFVLAPHDRFFSEALVSRLEKTLGVTAAGVLYVKGTAQHQASEAEVKPRANDVQVYGVDGRFWSLLENESQKGNVDADSKRESVGGNSDKAGVDGKVLRADEIAINQKLASALGVSVGDEIFLRVAKPSLLPLDAPLTRKGVADVTTTLRVKVKLIVTKEQGGRFSLQANQVQPFNAFVDLNWLREKINQPAKANMLLVGGETNRDSENSLTAEKLNDHLAEQWQLADVGLEIRKVPGQPWLELRTDRVFLEESVVKAVSQAGENLSAKPLHVLTYLVNEIYSSKTKKGTPYSMVTAIGGAVSTTAGNEDGQKDRNWPNSIEAVLVGDAKPESAGQLQEHNPIVINQWLADDLGVEAGDEVTLKYFVLGGGGDLEEIESEPFTIVRVVPIAGAAGDRSLLPQFPDMPSARSTLSSWKPGFNLTRKIGPEDDQYWKDYQGTPKAFVSIKAGQTMWANRFGQDTAMRFALPLTTAQASEKTCDSEKAGDDGPGAVVTGARMKLDVALQTQLDPAAIGLTFIPIREQALNAVNQGFDFAQLFLGFSFFLIIAALLLTGLLFVFAIEQRSAQVGTLLAVGLQPKRVRRLLLGEGLLLAAIGAAIGCAAGMFYTKVLLWGLTTVWKDAVSTGSLQFHVKPMTLAIGWGASVSVAVFTMWMVLRKQGKQPARVLLSGGSASVVPGRSASRWISDARGAMFVGAVFVLIAVSWLASLDSSAGMQSAGAFFGCGSMLLCGGLVLTYALLKHMAGKQLSLDVSAEDGSEAGGRSTFGLSLKSMGVRNNARRAGRSLATVGLLACGSFLVVAIGAFWLDTGESSKARDGGTGGFDLFAQTSLPVIYDLNTEKGLDTFGLVKEDLPEGTMFVSMRVRDGDDASCLNLNRAQNPRLVGVDSALLTRMNPFKFAARNVSFTSAWEQLKTPAHVFTAPDSSAVTAVPTIPAIGDQNTVMYGLGKGVGDVIEYKREDGTRFNVKIVALVGNSILQGSLFIDESHFKNLFPSISGYRMFLIETKDGTDASAAKLSGTLNENLADVGFTATATTKRLAAFNAVQNTYLGIFQALGGLGLLLGSIGLGVVVLRNVLERRREFALLAAVGFAKNKLRFLVLSEHWFLLITGLAIGVLSAVIAVLPAIRSRGEAVPYTLLAAIVIGVLASGVLWTWAASVSALRGSMLTALREE